MTSINGLNNSQAETAEITRSARATCSSHRFVMVLLAGALTPSPLRRSLDMPILCLPIDARHTLLDHWLRAALSTPGCEELIISVNSQADARQIRQCLQASRILQAPYQLRSNPSINIAVDTRECRGPGGVLLETTRYLSFDDDRPVVVAEASTLPFHDFTELLDSLDHSASGLVACTRSREPAGLYVFDAEVIAMLPEVAFLDLKEQALPYLYDRGKVIQPIITADRVIRLWTRDQYLEAVKTAHARNSESSCPCSAITEIDETARFSGFCVISDDVVIEPHAVIHDSIIHRGARIGAHAVIARSVVGSHAAVPCSSVIKDTIIERSEQSANGTSLRNRFGNKLIGRGVHQLHGDASR